MYINRIKTIQEYLIKRDIDAYISFLCDDHGSEYITNYYKSISFLCGFTGSAGTLLITKNDAFLWTDGRYFLQAEQQLNKANVKLKKIGIDESIIEYINLNCLKVAFDFKVANVSFVKQLNKKICLIDESNLLNKLWDNRPQLSKRKIFLLPHDAYKLSKNEKCHKTLNHCKNSDNYGVLVTALDDIAWLLNARGFDIPHNPVFMSFLLLSKIDNKEIYTLYINNKKLDEATKNDFISNGFIIKPYNKIYQDIKNFPYLIYYNDLKTNYKLFSLMSSKRNVTLWPTINKAIKTNIDIKHSKLAHIKDGIAMCKFIYYLKTNVGKIKMSEISVSNHLEKLRRKQGAFDLSFNTIAGYKEHGAIVHYSATKDSNKEILDDGFLLVDSGGQYYYGTTDITRTIAFKNISDEMKYHFTLVLKSHIDLAMAIFNKKTTDAKLDEIARKPLWDVNLDYNHGTGHGIGHMLNVHEGPQSIRYNKVKPTIMKKNMITSDEPGLYLKDKYGIRHENEILCVKYDKDHLCFEPLTYVPFDLDAIDKSLLSKQEINYLNNYHQMVYETISKHLNLKERKYLAYATRKI